MLPYHFWLAKRCFLLTEPMTVNFKIESSFFFPWKMRLEYLHYFIISPQVMSYLLQEGIEEDDLVSLQKGNVCMP